MVFIVRLVLLGKWKVAKNKIKKTLHPKLKKVAWLFTKKILQYDIA